MGSYKGGGALEEEALVTKKKSKRHRRKKSKKHRRRSPEEEEEAVAALPQIELPTRKKTSLSISKRLAMGGMVHSRVGAGDWIKMKDEHGHIYYFNKKTEQSQWESPYQYQKVPPPWTLREADGCRTYVNAKTGQELQEARAATGDVYYYDHATGESQWEKPWEKKVHYEHEHAAAEAATSTTGHMTRARRHTLYTKVSGTGGAGY